MQQVSARRAARDRFAGLGTLSQRQRRPSVIAIGGGRCQCRSIATSPPGSVRVTVRQESHVILEDHDGDSGADQRVGDFGSECDHDSAGDDAEGDETVDARVIAVGDERGAREAATASPASFSARNERRKKAIPSGTAVRASPTLCMRSARSATEPDRARIAAWIPAVSPRIARLSATVRTPARERAIERSTRPCEWAWPLCAWLSTSSWPRPRGWVA